jgi:hypothetical protein
VSDKWRVGTHVPVNVYEGDRPICQCHTALDAKRIVEAVNAAAQAPPTWYSPFTFPERDGHYLGIVDCDYVLATFRRQDEHTGHWFPSWGLKAWTQLPLYASHTEHTPAAEPAPIDTQGPEDFWKAWAKVLENAGADINSDKWFKFVVDYAVSLKPHSSIIHTDLTVRCSGCKGTLIWRYSEEKDEIEIFHSCSQLPAINTVHGEDR